MIWDFSCRRRSDGLLPLPPVRYLNLSRFMVGASWDGLEQKAVFFFSSFNLPAAELVLSLAVPGDSVDVKCENIYKDFSECVLELGESMDNYQENVTSERGVAAVCSHWEAFHTCALTALSDCQEEVSSIWETLRQDSRKIRFQGSLFDLCSPSSSPSLSSPSAVLILPLMLALTGPGWASA
uniref:Neuritin 1b n=1 Tax=Astatotilapia calliptera TaxID=8154 RepID=A0AAX7VPQ1_ASTCA